MTRWARHRWRLVLGDQPHSVYAAGNLTHRAERRDPGDATVESELIKGVRYRAGIQPHQSCGDFILSCSHRSRCEIAEAAEILFLLFVARRQLEQPRGVAAEDVVLGLLGEERQVVDRRR